MERTTAIEAALKTAVAASDARNSASRSDECRRCRFWVAGRHGPHGGSHPDDLPGECRRRAPVPVPNAWATTLKYLTMISWRFCSEEERQKEFEDWEDVDDSCKTWWPNTRAVDWCGDFVRLERR